MSITTLPPSEAEAKAEAAEEQKKKGGDLDRDLDLPSITTEQLRLHASPDDLWVAIDGKVYDVTRWAARHPGGDLPLLQLAGQDVTDAFLAFHPLATTLPLLPPLLVARLSDYRVSPASRDFRVLLHRLHAQGLFRRPSALSLLSPISVLVLFLLALLALRPLPLLSAALLGLAWIQSGWLGHDSGHYLILPPYRRLNRVLQLLAGNCLTGISIAWWRRNHNAHHFSCNSLDHDPDLHHVPLFAVSGHLFRGLFSRYYARPIRFDALARLLVSYQHWTFYPVMCVARVNLFLQSLFLLLSPVKVPSRAVELACVGVFWLWFPTLLWSLPSWPLRIAYVLVSFAVTSVQHVQFCLNHFSSEVYVGKPRGNDWFERQTRGTLDIDCPPWMDWFHGGLQFQLEHHLFPRLPRCHLRSVAPLVRELCRKHGLKYSSAGFLEANRMTLRTLRAAAMEARNLVWEAINTHG